MSAMPRDGSRLALRHYRSKFPFRDAKQEKQKLALAVFDVGNLTIAHVEDAVGDPGGFGVVGDHQDRLIKLTT